jgi:hypothetical protein
MEGTTHSALTKSAVLRCFPAVLLVLAGANCAKTPDADSRTARVGIRADTLSGPRHEIFSVWRAYVEAGADKFEPSPHWSAADQRVWPIFDLAAAWIYFGAPNHPRPRVTLVSIDPIVPGADSVFVVRAEYTTRDTATGAELPVGVTRTFAEREGNRWVLAAPLPRLTATWPQVKRGPITFIHGPDHPFNEARAMRSVRFVDSLARAFDIAAPGEITFYIADRPEELARIVGVDLPLPETSNGRAVPANRMVLSGLPIYGEFYPHELAHLVLGQWLADHRASSTMDEGMAHWLGGSTGRSFAGLMRELDAELNRRSTLTLDSVLGPGHRLDSLANRSAAALLALANERGGIRAVKATLTSRQSPRGPDHVAAAAEAMGWKRAELDGAWRDFVRRRSRGGDSNLR